MYKNPCTYLIAIFLVHIYLPYRHAKWYSYVKVENALGELNLVERVTNKTNLKLCRYEAIINDNYYTSVSDVYKFHDFENALVGGEFFPVHCFSSVRTAIIVPYRNRRQHLDIFLNYMHHFLQKQDIHYRIFIVEQNNDNPFNRANLLNMGAHEAIKLNYSCLILHDVDLLPLSSGNIYACAKKPRHMSSSLDTFRYNLPYEEIFGGVISIRATDFKKVNGMSNEYQGWGGEDDDFYWRLKTANLQPYRFSPDISRYTMLKHKKAKPSERRFEKLRSFLDRQSNDGLNSLSDNYLVNLEKLYTNVIVF